MRAQPNNMGYVKVQLKRSDGKPWNEQHEYSLPKGLNTILSVNVGKGNLLVDIGERGETRRVNPHLTPEDAATRVRKHCLFPAFARTVMFVYCTAVASLPVPRRNRTCQS